MVKRQRALLLILLSCLIIAPLQGIITGAQVWRKLYPDGYHYLYCFFDGHVDYKDGRLGKLQANALIKAASQSQSPFFIVEDLCSYQGKNPTYAAIAQGRMELYALYCNLKEDKVYDYPSLLCSLNPLCKQAGIDFENAECRYFYYRPQEPMSVAEVMRELQSSLLRLKPYAHNPFIQSYRESISFLLCRSAYKNLSSLNAVAYHLVNANILASIIEQEATHKNIFVCAGAAHCNSLAVDMSEMGYTWVGEYGVHPGSYDETVAHTLDIITFFEQHIWPLDATVKKA
jgi:hypothetical protein